MIKLERSEAPACLPDERVKELTARYVDTGESVWNFDGLKASLLELSFQKCAYCECDLSQGPAYMEVEHFIAKDLDSSKVVEWENLLPSCKRCNSSKGKHDVRAEPIVNPFTDNPKDHLSFRLYRFVNKSVIGKNTIDVVNLNDSDRAVTVRFEVGTQIYDSLCSALEKAELYAENQTARRRNSLINQMRRILQECQPSASYAATTATVLHSEANYGEVRQYMIGEGLWNAELEALHTGSLTLAMDMR